MKARQSDLRRREGRGGERNIGAKNELFVYDSCLGAAGFLRPRASSAFSASTSEDGM